MLFVELESSLVLEESLFSSGDDIRACVSLETAWFARTLLGTVNWRLSFCWTVVVNDSFEGIASLVNEFEMSLLLSLTSGDLVWFLTVAFGRDLVAGSGGGTGPEFTFSISSVLLLPELAFEG